MIKPLVGVANDGPGDAAVVRPVLDSQRGLVISCGMNPCYGDLDPYHMAASAIDEAVRNCVAVGADPSRIAILDNFCWGYTDRPETLGSLVRAALACHDVAVAFGTPFISGKDSLNNEFSFEDEQGNKQTIAIPASLLISALGQVDDVRTMRHHGPESNRATGCTRSVSPATSWADRILPRSTNWLADRPRRWTRMPPAGFSPPCTRRFAPAWCGAATT